MHVRIKLRSDESTQVHYLGKSRTHAAQKIFLTTEEKQQTVAAVIHVKIIHVCSMYNMGKKIMYIVRRQYLEPVFVNVAIEQ